MNIVILSSILPYPLNSGGAQAQYNIINELRKQHHITFIFPENANNTRKAMRGLQQRWPDVSIICYSYLKQLLHFRFVKEKAIRAIKLVFCHNNDFLVERTVKPYGYYPTRDFVRFVEQQAKHAGVQLFQIDFFPYLNMIEHLKIDAPKLFIHHEIRFIRNERLLSNVQLNPSQKVSLREQKQQEIANLQHFDHIITLTGEDRKLLIKAGVSRPISVSPAAVDTTPLPYKEWNGVVSCVGGYRHFPNQEGMDWFLQEVSPLLPANVPLHIIGQGWPERYSINNNTELKGFVPSLPSALHGTIMIVPILSGSGMRMKILEAAAMSLPIVTTTIGVEGLSFINEKSCLIADTPHQFAKALMRLFHDASLRQQIGNTARQVYEDNYSVTALAKRRNEIYLSLLPQK